MREDQRQRILMNSYSKNYGNKVVKSNEFPRVDEEAQSIKKFDFNIC